MSGKPKKVLIVEDDAQIVTGTKLRLESAGYETCSAADGDAGVIAAHEEHPDLVLMDVSMPRLNGLDALARLRADRSTAGIPVVMLSASMPDQRRALDAGARFFVRKPYTSDELIIAVERAMVSSDDICAS
jgi:CheY-like chemotaxis protein